MSVYEVESWGQYHVNEWIEYLAIERGDKTPEQVEKETHTSLMDFAAKVNAQQKGKKKAKKK